MIHPILLRIGNIIQVIGGNGQPYFSEVIAINNIKITLDNILFESISQATCIVEYNQDEIFGVPLTEEILLKCGFEKSKFGAYPCQFMHTIYKLGFDIVGDCFLASWGNVPINEIGYVHQLQNLYFALIQKEMEISNLKPLHDNANKL